MNPFILLNFVFTRFQYDSVLCVNTSRGVDEVQRVVDGAVLGHLLDVPISSPLITVAATSSWGAGLVGANRVERWAHTEAVALMARIIITVDPRSGKPVLITFLRERSSKSRSIRRTTPGSQACDVNYAWAGHVTTPPSEYAHARVSNAGGNGGGAHLLPVARNNCICEFRVDSAGETSTREHPATRRSNVGP